MTDREAARAEIRALVARYQALDATQRRRYSEEEVKQGFLLPLFRALGWDVEKRDEVRAEARSGRGLADYLFLIEGVTRFTLEAKNFRANLDDSALIRQAISYAWNKNVLWALLGNFERLVILSADPQISPIYLARLRVLRCERFADEDFEDLWRLSRPAMAQRLLEQVAEREGRLAPRENVSRALFRSLTFWRRLLFAEITQMGATFWASDQAKVDEAISRFLDRLIFIRTMEDRGIEEDRLQSLLRQRGKKPLFDELLALFREMDRHYNARLFAGHALDTPGALHNDVLLGQIIEGLWQARGRRARYDFAAIDADVLGAVYEQYLAFRAQDPGGEQDAEQGMGRRKALGIYYTPGHVVRHIVRQTLGRLLAAPGMTAQRAHRLRVLDPACGSGSFLIEAFRVLDEWLAEHGDAEDRAHEHLRRQRILLRNLYGVDLDPQAVEVARLNLLLRAAWQRGKLPMLHNIHHGNSLIDDGAVAGAAAFDWRAKFPQVMAEGGFDVVLGNPPYGAALTAAERQWLRERYQTGNTNTAALFTKLADELTKNGGGCAGLIVPRALCYVRNWRKLRALLLPGLRELVDVGRAWEEVNLEQVIVLWQRGAETPAYRSLRREHEAFHFVTEMPKADCGRFGILLCGVDEGELAVGRKLAGHDRLGNHTTNNPGQNFPLAYLARQTRGRPVLGGKEVKPWLLSGKKGLAGDVPLKDSAFARPGNLLMRKVLTFVAEPVPHVRLIAAPIPDQPDFVIHDGVKQLRLNADCPFSDKYLMALLNSRLLRWYAWRFVYALATMTLNFDTPASAPLPVAAIDFSDAAARARYDALVALAQRMLTLQQAQARDTEARDDRRHERARQIAQLERELDAQVYALYGLDDVEIALVEGAPV